MLTTILFNMRTMAMDLGTLPIGTSITSVDPLVGILIGAVGALFSALIAFCKYIIDQQARQLEDVTKQNIELRIDNTNTQKQILSNQQAFQENINEVVKYITELRTLAFRDGKGGN